MVGTQFARITKISIICVAFPTLRKYENRTVGWEIFNCYNIYKMWHIFPLIKKYAKL